MIDRSVQRDAAHLGDRGGASQQWAGQTGASTSCVRLPSEECLTASGDKKSQSRVKEPFRGTQRLAAPTDHSGDVCNCVCSGKTLGASLAFTSTDLEKCSAASLKSMGAVRARADQNITITHTAVHQFTSGEETNPASRCF